MKSIGWLEMSMMVPDNWDLVAESGGLSEAFMRFDSVDRTQMELKWERTKKRGDALPLLALDGYVKEVTKSMKDKKSLVVIEKGNARVSDHKASFSTWKVKDDSFITTCWLCPNEGKIVLVQYTLAPGETKDDKFEEILRGIQCHTDEDFYPYRLFGTKFRVPKDYRLSTRKILVGRFRATFMHGSSLLYVSSIGLAKEQLKKHKTLGQLFNSGEAKEARKIPGISALAKKIKDTDEVIDLSQTSKGTIPFITGDKKNRLKIYLDEAFNKVFIAGYSCKPDEVGRADAFIESLEGCE
ncbi:MAG TPA: hypothetical protein VEG31_00760 [Thermoproteota archaeon]|nr:hypothetical protein [Thermoproteota archaeon]